MMMTMMMIWVIGLVLVHRTFENHPFWLPYIYRSHFVSVSLSR